MSFNKRLHERISAPDVGLVDVYRLDTGARTFICSSLLQDISEGGVGIQTDSGLPPGATLHLHNRFVSYYTKVVRCVEVDGVFIVGLQFATGMPKPRVDKLKEAKSRLAAVAPSGKARSAATATPAKATAPGKVTSSVRVTPKAQPEQGWWRKLDPRSWGS
jgi:PilZ domain